MGEKYEIDWRLALATSQINDIQIKKCIMIKKTKLPDCKIINCLNEKSSDIKDGDFNFIFQLEEIRKKVSDEVTRINLMFPEFTPHDEKYHLNKLFFIADELLGREVIENMNVVELFTFSVSLYAHDWGMAISEEEKDIIINERKTSDDFSLLSDEHERFADFCLQRNIVKQKIDLPDWQDYIRQTHAFRSGARIKSYFNAINSGIAEVCSRLCEGHSLDFDIIDDPYSYPTDYAVFRQVVNIKALAIYIRLVDLLDLGEDRTPYVLWKFVSPRNKFSKMEWSKHRALQPVSFSNYQKGRYIQVDGSTDNQNVYMSIMDLKRYVNYQFKQSNDLLNRMNHSYHKLDLFHIDWRIAARGFKPIPIQFEFDRMRMFEILGDEIYQNDGFVFIRELLQNAIDAIKLRTEVLEKNGLGFNNGKIVIDISDYNDSYYCVSVKDNGIGMDEYIIRNYLSIAGKSYYKSRDFEKEGFKMEPISRFGIGVLSCFMLSDYIEIKTCREPYISGNSDKLKIIIPSKDNYFRIEEIHSPLEIGTSYSIYVLKDKLAEYKIHDFNITQYIKEVAGFVEYPIEVNELGKKTIITNPTNTKEKEEDSIKHSITYEYPLDTAIKPQNIATAREYFTERMILLKEDLKLERFEGCITFLIPKTADLDIINIGRSWPIHDVRVSSTQSKIEKDCRIQWDDDWVDFNRGLYRNKNKSLSVKKSESYSVFINGILLSNATPPEISPRGEDDYYKHGYNYNSLDECFLVPKMTVNVPNTADLKIDLARSTLKSNERWDKQIWEAFFSYIKNNDIEEIKKQEDAIKYFHIGKLSTFYRLTSKILLEKIFININELPIPIINSDNKLGFIYIDSSKKDFELIKPCRYIQKEIKSVIYNQYIQYSSPYDGILKRREGKALIAISSEVYSEDSLASLKNVNNTIESFLYKNFIPTRLEFIKSPLGSEYPWIQEIYSVSEAIAPFDILALDLQEKSILDLSLVEFTHLCLQLKGVFSRFPKVLDFSSPYSDCSFYAWTHINRTHELADKLIKFLIEIYRIKKNESLPAKLYGEIIDRLNNLPFFDYSYGHQESNLSKINQDINSINEICKAEKIKIGELPNIDIKDFVQNSFVIKEDTISPNDYRGYNDCVTKWGGQL